MFGVGGFNPLWNAGFVCNPFRTLSDAEWEEIALLPTEVAAVLSMKPQSHLQILGKQGRGKSSSLRAIRGEARRFTVPAIYEYVPEGRSEFVSQIIQPGLFCLDEVQRLQLDERQRLLQQATRYGVRLVLGTHEDMSPLFDRYSLPLQTVTIDSQDETHFTTIWNRRLTTFARQDMPHATLTANAYAYLRARFDTDLRSTERFLYEFFQAHVRAPGSISDSDLARSAY